MRIGTFLFFCFLLFAFSAFAQEDTTAKSLIEVIVTANRTVQQEIKIPYVINTINRKELNRFQPRTTPEALMGTTGVFVQKTNHGGGSAFIRGLTGNQTLILIDGIRLNNSAFRFGPNQYLNTIDLFTIQQIEVVKGTGSVQYGTDALGGTIHVITKDAALSETKKWNGAVQGKFMSGGMEQTGRGEFNYSSSKFAATGGVTIRNFGDILGGDTTGFQSPSGYKEMAFDVKLKFLLRHNIEFTTAHQSMHQQNVPVFHKVRLENFLRNEMDPQQRMLSYAKLKIENSNPFFKTIELTASHQQTKEGRNSQKNGSAVLRKELDKVNTYGFTLDLHSVFSKHWTSTSGIDLYTDKVNSTRNDMNTATQVIAAKRGLYPNGSGYGNYSLFTLHQFQFRSFQINSGLRLNTFGIHITDTTLGKVEVNPAALVGNMAMLYNFRKYHQLFASFNNSYRAPNIDDMGTLGIVDFRYELPAYDLQPEQSFNYELGYKFRNKNINAAASVFYMQLQNLITRVRKGNETISGYSVYVKENTDKAFISGAEAEVGMLIFKNVKLQTGLSYLYGQNKTRNEPLRRIPPLNGRVCATYKKEKWYAAVETWFASAQNRLAQGDKDDNRIPAGGTPGYSVLNLYAGWALKTVQIQTGFQNLLNKDYRTHGSGINGVGRSMFLSFILTVK